MKTTAHYTWYLEPRSESANEAIGQMLADVGDAELNECKRIKCYDDKTRSLWEVRDYTDVERFINSEHKFHIYRKPSGEGALPHRYRPPRKSAKDAPIKTAADLLKD